MARPSSAILTERESQLMEILWTQGPATAEAVRRCSPISLAPRVNARGDAVAPSRHGARSEYQRADVDRRDHHSGQE